MKPAEIVTARIIDSLNKNSVPWRQTWSARQRGINFSTGKAYRGINALMCEIFEMNGAVSQLLSYKQADGMGLHVKKGSKSELIVFNSFIFTNAAGEKISPESYNQKRGDKKIPFLKGHSMFTLENIADADNNPVTPKGVEKRIEFDTSEIVTMLEKLGIDYRFSPGGQPSYSPGENRLNLCNPENFEGAAYVWRTLFHEMAHATGHETRLARTFGAKGSPEYAFEELVAEITSQFLMNHFQIVENEVLEISQSYIQGWLTVLNGDSKIIIKAASAAQKAMDWILKGLGESPEPVED